jgi:hypothetical protein
VLARSASTGSRHRHSLGVRRRPEFPTSARTLASFCAWEKAGYRCRRALTLKSNAWEWKTDAADYPTGKDQNCEGMREKAEEDCLFWAL